MTTAWRPELDDPLFQGHRKAWAEELEPEISDHEIGWVGKKVLVARKFSATAKFNNPIVEVGSTVRVPPGKSFSTGGFPYQLPFVLEEPFSGDTCFTSYANLSNPEIAGQPVEVEVSGTFEASAEFYPPSIDIGSPEVTSPRFEAVAEFFSPEVFVGFIVQVPRIGDAEGFPYPIPFSLDKSSGTIAKFSNPVVSTSSVVQSPRMTAGAEIRSPEITSDCQIEMPRMEATASMPDPVVSVDVEMQSPRWTAHAGLPSPVIEDGDVVEPSIMTASASFYSPEVIVTKNLVVNVPMFGGGDRGFDYELPFSLNDPVLPTMARFSNPDVVVGYEPQSGRLSASGTLVPPEIIVGYEMPPTTMSSSAVFQNPSISVGVEVSAQAFLSTASFSAPRILMSDRFFEITASGGFFFADNYLQAYRYIDVVALGGGAAGKKGSIISAGNGGRPGNYAVKRWDRGADPPNSWTNLSVTIGNGASSSNNNSGGNTTVGLFIGGTLVDSFQANGGSGSQSPRDGKGPGDYSFNSISATGGSGNGSVPGSGGRGGASGFPRGNNGDGGGRGQVWLRFSMDS